MSIAIPTRERFQRQFFSLEELGEEVTYLFEEAIEGTDEKRTYSIEISVKITRQNDSYNEDVVFVETRLEMSPGDRPALTDFSEQVDYRTESFYGTAEVILISTCHA